MDDLIKKNKFDYNQTANLVVKKDDTKIRYSDATGEAESIVGRLPGKMGDRVSYTQPIHLKNLVEKNKKRKAEKYKFGTKTALELDNLVELRYTPKTKETEIIYESLLSEVSPFLSDQDGSLLKEAVDEIIFLVKDDKIKDSDKEIKAKEILAELTPEKFARIYEKVNSLSDFAQSLDGQNLKREEIQAIELHEEEASQSHSEVEEAEQSDDEISYSHIKKTEVQPEVSEIKFDVDKYDGFWLQKQLKSNGFMEEELPKLEGEILFLLNKGSNRVLENKLLLLLGKDNFDLIKELIDFRFEIYYLTVLNRASSEQERMRIIEEMEKNESGQQILTSLQAKIKFQDKESKLVALMQNELNKLEIAKKKNEESLFRIVDEIDSNTHKQVLDLDNLKFDDNVKLNRKAVKLPNLQRVSYDSYEEVFVPAAKASSKDRAELFVKEVPEWAIPAFQYTDSQDNLRTIEKFNPVQTAVYETAFNSDESMLVCAPTSAGKTIISLFTVLRLIANHRDAEGNIDLSSFKCVYIAPMKALVKEVVGNFSNKLEAFGLKVREISGDISLSKQEIEETQVIVTTPEKWDIITRKSNDRSFTELVKLIIVDEVHLLHDSRGPVLESIIARTVRLNENWNTKIRLVGLSATLPNYQDVAAFMRVDEKGLFYFDASYRPVPLEQIYVGVTEKKAVKKLRIINDVAYSKISERVNKHQVICFVHSRKETVRWARTVKATAEGKGEINKFFRDDPTRRSVLEAEMSKFSDKNLRELVPLGIAFHHAGMSRMERELVEDLFANGFIQLIVSTATLAWGVNLPAHTVIIKGTQIYNSEKGRWTELSHQDLLQMLGRAGRFGHDSSGEGIIVTSQSEINHYLSLLNQQMPIESQLLSVLTDSLNAEVVLGGVNSLKDGVNWLSYTYLFVRMLANHRLYGITFDEIERDSTLLQRRINLIHSAALILEKNGLVVYDKRSGSLTATYLGKIASYYYIRNTSIAVYNKHLKPDLNTIDLLRIFSFSSEFQQIPVRQEEKEEMLKLLNNVPIPVKGGASEPVSKVNILLQAYISRLNLQGYALGSDMVYIAQSAGRIFRALFEICLKRGWAQLAGTTLNYCKMVEKRMWSAYSPLRQFNELPEDVLYKLERKEELKWERFYDMSVQQLSTLVEPSRASKVHKLVNSFPRFDVEVFVQPITRSAVKFETVLSPVFQWNKRHHGNAETFWILVEDGDSEKILHSEMFVLKEKKATEDVTFTFVLPLTDPVPPQYFVRVVSNKWLNCEKQVAASFKHLILPDRFPRNTEVLEMQPIKTNELDLGDFKEVFSEIDELNKLQTQVQAAVCSTDDSLFIGAPKGSGKQIVAEMAVIRALRTKKKGEGPVIFISPVKEKVERVLSRWSNLFSRQGYVVNGLTGQLGFDRKLFDRSDIVVCSVEHLDMFSRGWRKKEKVKRASLLVVNEAHLIGESGGAMEAVLSRFRYMSFELRALHQQNKLGFPLKELRIVTLSHPIANIKEFTDWLGIASSNIFNFNQGCRAKPQLISIQGFDQKQRKVRLTAESKPVYNTLKYNIQENALIFVSDKKHAKELALDIVSYSTQDDSKERFKTEGFHGEFSYSDKVLNYCLESGIAFLHSGLLREERDELQTLFKEGRVKVLVVPHTQLWEVAVKSEMTLIVDPLKYEGQWVDFSVAELLEAVGTASLPTQGENNKVFLFCQTSKKEFFKKFLNESLPVESHLNHFIHDHLNAETTAGTIRSKQNCIDWLTWTFMYRRLLKNPNYYNLKGKSNEFLNDFLSELVEESLEDLSKAGTIMVKEDSKVQPLNFSVVSVYFYVKYDSLELFSNNVRADSKIKNILDIVCEAVEFEQIPIRSGDEKILKMLGQEILYKTEEEAVHNVPSTKASILLQLYLSRKPVPADFIEDQKEILKIALRLVQALVDVSSSKGFFKATFHAMELSQMIVQAMWIGQPDLLQLPYLEERVNAFAEKGVRDLEEFIGMEEEERQAVLNMDEQRVSEIAAVCNRYPNVNMEIKQDTAAVEGLPVEFSVLLERDIEEDEQVEPLQAQFFPLLKEENWWILFGEEETQKLLAIKRVNGLERQALSKLKFVAPEGGKHTLVAYLLCDSWIGCDREEEFELTVQQNTQ